MLLLVYQIVYILPKVFYPLRHSCWDQLLFGCFPPFLESGVYADFLDEVVDSTKVGFSRSKAENFFGMKIEVCSR